MVSQEQGQSRNKFHVMLVHGYLLSLSIATVSFMRQVKHRESAVSKGSLHKQQTTASTSSEVSARIVDFVVPVAPSEDPSNPGNSWEHGEENNGRSAAVPGER